MTLKLLNNITVVDGNNILNRVWYGAKENELYADSILSKTIERINNFEGNTIFLFDSYSAHRKEISDEYKATRTKNEELSKWMRAKRLFISEYLEQKTLLVEGWEADDLAAAIVKYLNNFDSTTVNLVSNDKDWWSLINEKTFIINPSNWQTINEQYMVENFSVTPDQWEVYKALIGDTSDNIKGVPGVGPKRAAACIKELWPQNLWWDNDEAELVNKYIKPYKTEFDLALSLVTLNPNVNIDWAEILDY